MSRPVISTHAGDDSDGKLWGIEGINILFVVTRLLLSIGLSLMLFRQQDHSPAFSVEGRLAYYKSPETNRESYSICADSFSEITPPKTISAKAT